VACVASQLKLNDETAGESSKGNSSEHGRGYGHGGGQEGGRGGSKAASGGRRGAPKAGDIAGDECWYCGKEGHWAQECCKKKKDEQFHTAQADGMESALLVATVLEETHAGSAPVITNIEIVVNTTEVHLQEDKLFVQLGNKKDSGHTRWILDTGATNHMAGSSSSFTDLDEAIRRTMRFGDGSMLGIEGKGTVVMECKNGGQRVPHLH
jgi:hypothetical protein